jgi:hypothetical protein
MENAPPNLAEDNPVKKPEGKKKKRNAEAIGVFADAPRQLRDLEQTARIEALEASQLHGKKVAPERIGHVLVTAEGKPSARTERPPKHEPKVDKLIATMSRAELLALSEKVAVENTTLRQVYETHLVGEQGLRRLINEYVRGGDVQRALREELVEHEIDFERDPMFRDRKRPDLITSHDTAGHETLEALLEKANVLGKAETQEAAAVLKARQAHHEQQRQHHQKYRRLLDVSMVAAITILFALVIMLLLRKG